MIHEIFTIMKKLTALLILMVSISMISFGKKDTDAWKKEKTLDQQFSVFKDNLKYWNGSYFLNDLQFNEFFQAVNDSIAVMEKKVLDDKNQIKTLQDELNNKIKETGEIQAKLDSSFERENSINVLGAYVSKRMYSLTMYILILTALVISAITFILYKRSNNVTKRIKKDYEDLKEEYEIHKKSALERYVKINTELTKARMELNRR
jgi:hypothetical protein